MISGLLLSIYDCLIFLIKVSAHGQLAPLLWVPWQRTEWRGGIAEEEHKIVPLVIQVSFLCVLSNPPSVLLGSYFLTCGKKSGFIILLHCIHFELIFVCSEVDIWIHPWPLAVACVSPTVERTLQDCPCSFFLPLLFYSLRPPPFLPLPVPTPTPPVSCLTT